MYGGLYLPEHGHEFFMEVPLRQGDLLGERYEIMESHKSEHYDHVFSAEDLLGMKKVLLCMVWDRPVASLEKLYYELSVNHQVADYTHVLRLFDIHRLRLGSAEFAVLVKENPEGESLRNRLTMNRDHLRHDGGMEYFRQICNGAAALHGKEIIHLNLMPEHIYIGDHGVKIGGTERSILASDVQKRHPHSITLYSSPEVAANGHRFFDHRADIYSLGVILLELLHPNGLIPVPDLSRPPSVPEHLYNIVKKCTEKDMDARFQDVHELLYALDGDTHETALTRIHELLDKAIALYDEDRLLEASEMLESLLETDPGHEKAIRLKKDIRNRYDEVSVLYREMDRNMQREDLSTLIDQLKRAVSIYPEHPDGKIIQQRILTRSTKFKELLMS